MQDQKGGVRKQITNLSAMTTCSIHRPSFIVGDSNNLDGLGFHGVKLCKMSGRGANPVGRAGLHQAADEGLVGGREFRCAKKGLCTMEDGPVGRWLWRPILKCGLPKKNYGL